MQGHRLTAVATGTRWGVDFDERVVPAAVSDLTSPLGGGPDGDLDVDAVVVGAGPNGLVATCLLAMAGWDVCLLERNRFVGGAVASVEHTPGYVSDLYSAFYPLAAASPVLAPLDLESFGLSWRRSPSVLAHVPHPNSELAAVLHPDPYATAAALDIDAPGDGDAWLRLHRDWRTVREPLLDALFTPFPPVLAMLRLLRRTGTPQALRLARRLILPVDRLGAELFRGEHGRLLLAGNAMHADVPAIAPGSGAFALILTMVGQDVGFPVPQGGAGALASALLRRALAAGARVHTAATVSRIVVGHGRALGVLTEGGQRVRARRAVLADVAAPTLYRELLRPQDLPSGLPAELERCFEWDLPTVKCNWTLRGPMPWRTKGVAGAGTVHLGTDLAGLTAWSSALGSGQRSPHTFQILGQFAAADPTRAPEDGETVWAYSHLPRRTTDPAQAAELARRMDQELEEHAPGFGDLVVDRFDQLPQDLAEHDVNLVEGAVNGGTAQLFQQLVFRPTPGLGRPETPVPGLYLASAAISPGGGVHGGCGAQAARAALAGARFGGIPGRLLAGAARHLAG
jgi:phytoene dehydrogenase-like protein